MPLGPPGPRLVASNRNASDDGTPDHGGSPSSVDEFTGVDELKNRHTDLQSVVSAADIATICLDTELRIRWFTPAVQQIVDLDSSDAGRPFADVAHDFVDGDVIAVARQVLESLTPVESEVQCYDDRTFIRRVAAYRGNGIGAELQIDAQPGHGTTVRCLIPLR